MIKLSVIGNLTRKPEIRKINSKNGEMAVLDVDMAVNSRQRNHETVTQFVRGTAWGALAETLAKYLDKGSKFYMDGPMTVDVFTKADGTPGTQIKMNIENFEFLSSAGAPASGSTGSSRPTNYDAKPKATEPMAVETDDLPF